MKPIGCDDNHVPVLIRLDRKDLLRQRGNSHAAAHQTEQHKAAEQLSHNACHARLPASRIGIDSEQVDRSGGSQSERRGGSAVARLRRTRMRAADLHCARMRLNRGRRRHAAALLKALDREDRSQINVLPLILRRVALVKSLLLDVIRGVRQKATPLPRSLELEQGAENRLLLVELLRVRRVQRDPPPR